jgi:putative phage-type endonuclease
MEKLQKKLDTYLSGIDAQPTQRSPEWYAIRKNTIGGSEIATVIGINPYNSVEGMIAGKLGINSFNGNTACRWGTMFEHVTEKFTQIILRMNDKIKEAGSIPGVIDRQRYSPDGLGIVQLLNCDDEPEYYVILFEFKAPLGTLPNGKIPNHYRPQIQTGMISIPLTEYSIFVNNCYRKCALSDLGFSGVYDKIYHGGDYKKRKYGLEKEKPYGCGVICFYQSQEEFDKVTQYYGYDSDSEEYDIGAAFDTSDIDYTQGSDHDRYSDYDMELLLNSNQSLIDFGSTSQFIVDRMFQLYDDKRIKVIYYPIMINHEAVNEMPFISTHALESDKSTVADPVAYGERCIEKFEKTCRDKKLCGIGFMPWKLMRSDVILENKDPEWLNTIREPLTNALDILNELNNCADPIAAYYKKYPMIDESVEYFEDISDMATFMNPAGSLSDMEHEETN